MDFMRLLRAVLAFCCCSASASKLFSADFYEPRGQRICRRGTERPCYKIAYFQDSWRKVNFEQASQACRSDGGELLSIESDSEQRLIQSFIQELRANDGDFWIGLRRDQSSQEASSDCPEQYHWLDGSKAAFRNWHWDEPSCGYEVCVVMYHQPSAPPGLGGLYMFQWNDDNCNTKNNFICKYSREKRPVPTALGNSTNTESPAVSPKPKYTSVTEADNEIKIRLPTDNALNIVYIVLPTIPLLLLLLVALGVFCFKLLSRKRKEQTEEACPKEMGYWADRCNSPSPDVYNVIRKQHDADLTSTRPDIKNTSFLGSSPDTPPGDYDNLAGRDTESGFVTLASTESGFVTNDIYETCQGRGRYYREAGWVENEIYSY
ncbi:layilin isoform X1 [Brienomyrus brachyistius]|uniref:layilin isoform X1 n=1 Tax=Brienomyrus brachyistius TaxID=42636 RepID=UPI0020B2083F|nr:layilin isoform X1 [Brienomyrus brachyistius]